MPNQLAMWRRGSVVRRMTEVTLREARLVLGWIMGDRFPPCTPPLYVTKPTRPTQPCIPPGSLNRVPTVIGCGKGGNVTSAGWQVIV